MCIIVINGVIMLHATSTKSKKGYQIIQRIIQLHAMKAGAIKEIELVT